MKAGLRSMQGMRWLVLAGFIVALAVAVSRGQAVPREMPECGESYPGEAPLPPAGEPPMVDAPMPPQSPTLPSSPFTPPPPTPLPPEQATPFAPAMPFPAAEPTDPPMPVVRLRVRAPARVEPDKEIEYHLTVENVSRADAHHVLVRDRLPRGVDEYVRAEPKCKQIKTKDGLTDLLWELGTLKAGEQKAIALTIKPKGTGDVENRAYVQFEHGQKITTRIAKAGGTPALRNVGVPPAKPSVRVQVIAPTQAILYQSIPFRIEVVNTGAVPLRNVVVTEELPDGLELGEGKPEPTGVKPLTWKLGDLAPHQTRRIECEVISKKEGKFSTKVKVTAEGGVTAAGSAAITVGEAKLKISISGPQRRLANRPIPYHITVRNLGTMPVTNVQVSDELPRDIEFVSASAEGRKEGGFVRWSLGTLAPGERRSLLLVLRAPKSGWCWNEATVRADNNLSDKANSGWIRIEAASTPVIEIDKQTDSLDVGQKATYTIRLFNPGKHGVFDPSVFINIPEELSIRSERGPTSGQQQGQLVRFDPVTVLDGGKEELYVVEVEAKKAGEAKLRAWWTGRLQETDPLGAWEDKTIILDPARPASGVASAPRETHSRR